jgi:hypothetical protein
MVKAGLLRIGGDNVGSRFFIAFKDISSFEEAEKNVDRIRTVADYIQSKLESEVFLVTWGDFPKALKGEQVMSLAYFPRRRVKG